MSRVNNLWMDQRKIDVTPLTNIIIIFADNSQYDLRLTDTYIYSCPVCDLPVFKFQSSRLKHNTKCSTDVSRRRTSEAADFNRVERSSLQAWISWVDWTLPFAQTTGELELICGEDVANQVAQQPPAVFLRGVDSFVPLLVSDEERVVLQELFAALQGDRGGRQEVQVCEEAARFNSFTRLFYLIFNCFVFWLFRRSTA